MAFTQTLTLGGLVAFSILSMLAEQGSTKLIHKADTEPQEVVRTEGLTYHATPTGSGNA